MNAKTAPLSLEKDSIWEKAKDCLQNGAQKIGKDIGNQSFNLLVGDDDVHETQEGGAAHFKLTDTAINHFTDKITHEFLVKLLEEKANEKVKHNRLERSISYFNRHSGSQAVVISDWNDIKTIEGLFKQYSIEAFQNQENPQGADALKNVLDEIDSHKQKKVNLEKRITQLATLQYLISEKSLNDKNTEKFCEDFKIQTQKNEGQSNQDFLLRVSGINITKVQETIKRKLGELEFIENTKTLPKSTPIAKEVSTHRNDVKGTILAILTVIGGIVGIEPVNLRSSSLEDVSGSKSISDRTQNNAITLGNDRSLKITGVDPLSLINRETQIFYENNKDSLTQALDQAMITIANLQSIDHHKEELIVSILSDSIEQITGVRPFLGISKQEENKENGDELSYSIIIIGTNLSFTITFTKN